MTYAAFEFAAFTLGRSYHVTKRCSMLGYSQFSRLLVL